MLKSKREGKREGKKKKKMGLLSLLEGLIGVTESLLEKLLSANPDATQVAGLATRINAMAATLDAAP